jgi:hypothetical protein
MGGGFSAFDINSLILLCFILSAGVLIFLDIIFLSTIAYWIGQSNQQYIFFSTFAAVIFRSPMSIDGYKQPND